MALLVFPYIFNSKLDLNGDNCYYYINATSLAEGDGYCGMFGEPTANFPPGYPLLMAPLRVITSSFVAQKVMNLVFFLFGVLMLFSILVREGIRREVAFVISAVVLTTPHLLEFSTMMMSEASCFFFVSLAFWAYQRISDENSGRMWRSYYIYVFIFSVLFSFYIRTQALVLFIAFLVGFVLMRRWRLSLLLLATTILGYMPWVIRNMLNGLGSSRYLDQVSFTSLGSKLTMLLVQALPESIVPYFKVDYMRSPSLLLWIISLVMFMFIVYGVWRLKGLRIVLYLFLAGGVGIVAIMDSPSLYRYLVILLPFFTAAFVVGLWDVSLILWNRVTGKVLSPWILLVLLLPGVMQGRNAMFKHSLPDIHETASNGYPPLYINYFSMARKIVGVEKSAVVASRKPELLYVAEGLIGVPFVKDGNDEDMVRYFLKCNVDYIIIDDSKSLVNDNITRLINKNTELFTVVSYILNPDIYLFRFEKDKALIRLMDYDANQSPTPSR